MPDIKMPEISGIKGKGEKIFLILDSSPMIMDDRIGGIPAYTVIKSEIIRVIDGLGPTTLFNVAVYDGGRTHLLFPSLVSANASNVAKAEQWLTPLNTVHANMKATDYGVKTLGPGGAENREDLRIMKFAPSTWQGEWFRPSMLAMKQQADAVFLFTHGWGWQRYPLKELNRGWYETSPGKRYLKCYEEAKKLFAKENKERLARGEAPRVLPNGSWHYNRAYFPGIAFPPPQNEYYYFTPGDYEEAFSAIREKFQPAAVQLKSGIADRKRSKKDGFSFNVVHFITESDKPSVHLKKLASYCDGDYRTIKGLKAIESSVKGNVPD